MAQAYRARFGTVAAGALALALAACSGDSGTGAGPGAPPGSPPGSPPPPPPPPAAAATMLDDMDEAARFAIQASFGEDFEGVQDMVGRDAAAWLADQFSRPVVPILPTLILRAGQGQSLDGRPHSDLFYAAMMEGNDPLRQRMVFALSQILVVSDSAMGSRPLQTAYYMDVLSENAFGNYRDLLEDVTYSPAMGEYLTYLRNRKGDPNSGRMPDENYARELLQLFTIGLVELNPDGTVRQGPDGPVEIFDNDDIEGLARVFTGLSLQGTGFFSGDAAPEGPYRPMQVFAQFHEDGEKAFLGTVIPAGTSGEASIDAALDTIFGHPNVGPFIARQLIQRFTASDPAPAYVARVAAAFDAGRFNAPNGRVFGDGRRGDLQATLAAILLDPVVHGDPAALGPNAGKLREPVLKFVQWARAFDVSDIRTDIESRLDDTSSPSDRLGQHPFRSPSVFNFYRPGFVAPGTLSGEAGLTAPELQVVNESTAIGYPNFITDFILDRTGSSTGPPTFVPDYSGEMAIANDAAMLVDRLDMLLTGGQMTDAERSAIEAAVAAIEIIESSAADDRRRRVQVAILMVMGSPSYGTIR